MAVQVYMIGDRGPYFYEDTTTHSAGTPWTFTGGAGAVSFNSTNNTVNDSGSGFTGGAVDMVAGDVIKVEGTANNDGLYVVDVVTAATLLLNEEHALTNETPAGVVTITVPASTGLSSETILVTSGVGSAIVDADNDTKVQVEEGVDEDIIRFDTGGSQRAQIDSDGVTLASGASVNEFSIDGTMGGNSDDAVPTEQAIVEYGATRVLAPAVIVDHTLVRGDGGARNVQDTGIVVDDSDNVSNVGTIRCATTLYRRYYHLSVGGFDPGASGATWVDPSANTTGGWQLNAVGETLIAGTDVHADWDAASDIMVDISFALNAAGNANDTVDLKLVAYYNGVGDTATKTQTVEVATTTDGTQFKVYKASFTIDHDLGGNVVDVGDEITFILNLETDTSEIDDIIITGGTFYYNTTHIGIESGDT